MHLTIVHHHAHIASVTAGERAAFHAFHHTFQNGRHEAHINGSTHNRVQEHELTAPLQVDFLAALDVHLVLLTVEFVSHGIGHTLGVGLHNEVYFTKLSGTTRLFLVAIVGARSLCDGFAIRNLGFNVFYRNLLVVLQTPFQCAQVELTLTVHNGLAQFLRLLNHPCGVFLAHLQQSGH